VLVRQRKKNGEEKEPGERKKKEVDEIAWVHHYPFARGARSPANDSGARSPANDSGARVLKKLVIVFGKGRFTSMTEANSKVKPLSAKIASQTCSIQLVESAWKEGDDKFQDFRTGYDFSVRDPFAFIPRD
jgi:hypothetical protein